MPKNGVGGVELGGDKGAVLVVFLYVGRQEQKNSKNNMLYSRGREKCLV